MAPTYWLDLFTVETWKEFLDHGGNVSGFSEKRRAVVQGIRPGDRLLCYLTRASRFVGLLEVVDKPFFDKEPIWSSDVYPNRVRVQVILALSPEHGVPVLEMREELTIFQNLHNPNYWQGPFRQSPTKWKAADGEAVVRALQEAKANPVNRPLGWRGRIRGEDVAWQESVVGVMTIPEDDRTESIQEPESAASIHTEEPESAASVHTEIQYLLVKLAADMGFDFHVATNDRSRAWRASD